MTVSDYMAVDELITRHHLAATPKEAALRAIKAGVDIETPDPKGYVTLAALVREGKISVKEIDASVRRILKLKFLAACSRIPTPMPPRPTPAPPRRMRSRWRAKPPCARPCC